MVRRYEDMNSRIFFDQGFRILYGMERNVVIADDQFIVEPTESEILYPISSVFLLFEPDVFLKDGNFAVNLNPQDGGLLGA